MGPDKKLVDRAIENVLPRITELRHRLHRSPELAFKEMRTAVELREFLKNLPLVLNKPILETDITGILEGQAEEQHENTRLLLRADMDALPIAERSDKPWVSLNPGAAHSCGHDGHMAMLAGALAVLSEFRKDLAGRLAFVFQPAEEQGGGGRKLIEKGLWPFLGNPGAAFALHGWTGLPEGVIGAIPGPMMAAENRFIINIEGKGGHGGKPHLAADPIVAAGSLITALQTIVSRNINPFSSAVVSICSVHGGEADNVIPCCVTLRGTIRYFDMALLEKVKQRMSEICAGISGTFGVACGAEFVSGYIPLVNDAGMVAAARGAITAGRGKNAWKDEVSPTMGAEDFAYYLQKAPGSFLFLGLGENWKNLHHPEFDFNDSVLAAGISALCSLAFHFLAAYG